MSPHGSSYSVNRAGGCVSQGQGHEDIDHERTQLSISKKNTGLDSTVSLLLAGIADRV